MKQKLNQYKIEHRISTLVDCALFEIKNNPASFQIGKIKYSQIDFNIRDGLVVASSGLYFSINLKSEVSATTFEYFFS